MSDGELNIPKRPRMLLQSHYIKSLQVVNHVAETKPTFEMAPYKTAVTVNFTATPLDDRLYVVEHQLGLRLNSSEDVELLTLDLTYCGVFDVDLHETSPGKNPFILLQGAKNLFPFMRAVVRNATGDSNHIPLNMANINYERIYTEELQKIVKQKRDEDEALKG